uniref:Uncharacterized protein n=1 Tax=Arundo donax TaxID=35708 RepID=A0A0A9CXS4_ARUDO
MSIVGVCTYPCCVPWLQKMNGYAVFHTGPAVRFLFLTDILLVSFVCEMGTYSGDGLAAMGWI